MPVGKLKRNREVTKSSGGKHIEISKYNPMTGTGVYKEKDIEYGSKGSPRVKYVEKQVVKRDNGLNWKSSKESRKLIVGGKKVKASSDFQTYKAGGSTIKKSPKVTVTAGGEKHVVYKKTTKKGEGKVGNIMVNHPTKDKGQWDTIDLTAKGRAKTIKQGVAATKKWHRDNPDYDYKGKGMAKSGAQQAAIAISMKKAGKKPKSLKKAQTGTSVKSTTQKDSTANNNWWLSDSIPSGVSNKLDSLNKKEKKNSSSKYYPWGKKVELKKPQMKSGGSTPAWTRKEGKNPEGGLNAKGVASYRAANPGSKLKTAVTTKPSKIKPGSEAAGRRKSFCARMSGMKKKLTSSKTANDPNSRINKSLRKWNC